jgi:tellurite resistance protein
VAKKSGGGVVGIVLIGIVGLIASVPKEVWIGIGVIAAIGTVIYWFSASKSSTDSRPSNSSSESRSHSSDRVQASTYQPPSSPRGGARPRPSSTWQPDEPVAVQSRSTYTPQTYRVPEAPARAADAQWVPAGQSVTIAGTIIEGGMLYVGTSLPTPLGADDPALINPKLNVSKAGNYTERGFGYWPSYTEISASARRSYLNWLAGGRKDPAAEIGYVFLYFYGLERRAILDAPKNEAAQADWPRISAELKRLLAIYGENHSFNGYATKLLDWVSLATYSSKLYLEPLPEYERNWELPLHLRLVLGQCALDQVPVPANVALAWARLDPNVPLRTPAVRCAEEFATLFIQKYSQAHGAGLFLPVNKTKLKFVYNAASAGFHGFGDVNLSFGDVPDVTVLTAPLKKLQAVVESATTELESYSRYLGRNPTQSGSLEALLLLPATLWPQGVLTQVRDIQTRAERGMVVMKLQELLQKFGAAGTVTKDKLAGLARALESMDVGMEPDILSGAKVPKGEDTIVLFGQKAHDKVARDTPTYQAAALTLQLANAVALADGEITAEELRQLRGQVEGWTHLTPAHQQRLRAHMRLLMDAPVSLTVLKKKLEPLQAGAKEAIAKFMAVVAQADGAVSPAEIKMLEKVYAALGVNPKNVFSDVHAVAATGSPAGPTPSSNANSPVPVTAAAGSFRLDTARIAALQQDTDQVSALLANIFKEEDVPTPATALVPNVADDGIAQESPAPAGIRGLDEAHTSFARLLLSRPSWTREELLDVASDLDLMLDGALERINDASFDVHDMPLTEGDEPITVNQELLEKVPA